MAWLLVGALGVFIAEEFALSATLKGLLVGIPLLSGAIWRVVAGPCSDRFGPKPVGLVVLVGILGGLLWVWQGGTSLTQVLLAGVLLGIAGASFAVSLPLASRAYPAAHQGLVMGIAASANSGIVLAAFFAPRLAEIIGWRAVFGWMMVPVFLTIILFQFLVPTHLGAGRRDRHISASALFSGVLRRGSLYWLCLVYAGTFGGFVGLCSFLPIYLHDQFGMNGVTAGTLTALSGLCGSAIRPLGGWAADRQGGLRVLSLVIPSMAGLLALSTQGGQATWVIAVLVLAVGVMGFGNGVVFQIVSERFRTDIGTASGIIGAAGSVGGFLLSAGLGLLKDLTGSYQPGWWSCVAVCLVIWATILVGLRRTGQTSDRCLDGGSLSR
jgi:NNP family nitrate/nitrite transporter-like MFS transporter